MNDSTDASRVKQGKDQTLDSHVPKSLLLSSGKAG